MIDDWTQTIGNKKSGIQHHAYLIVSENENIFEEICAYLTKEFGIVTRGNPDVWSASFDSFGIDEGRKMKNLQALKSFSGSERIFIIQTRVFTLEAQNTLLKMFEEPASGVHFFILMSSAGTLLPTLRSRLAEIHVGQIGEGVTQVISPQTYIKSSVTERLKMVKKLIDKKDIGGTNNFINSLILILKKGNKKNKEYRHSMRDLLEVNSYLQQRAPSVKMILEHISLTLPKG